MIGVFDSGVGGLSIYREIKKLIPQTSYIYFADKIHFPYGEKTAEEIIEYSYRISSFLIERGAKFIVVACNSATVSAINYLRNMFSIPFVGVVPAVKPAALSTKTGKIAVLLTETSSKGKTYHELIETWADGVSVISIQFPELVRLIEEGKIELPGTKNLLVDKLTWLKNLGVDTIVLGCTHFIFLKEIIISEFGDDFDILDPALGVAKQTYRIYTKFHEIDELSTKGDLFFTSGDVHSLKDFIRTWLKMNTDDVYHISLKCSNI